MIRVACLLALVGLLAVPRDFVLCIDDTGHVAIEASLELVPCQFVDDEPGFESEPAERCRDTPLAGESLRELREQTVVWGFIPTPAPPAPPLEIEAPSHPSSISPSASSRWLREHRTIVLLV